jgi:hypothetical protein
MSAAANMPATRIPISAEWSLLLAASSVDSAQEKSSRLGQLLQHPVQWSSVFDLANRHGVASLLYQALSANSLPIPPAQIRRLRDAYHGNVHKALFLSRELIRILEHLETLGLEVIPYKGLALAESMYGDVALRQAGDIDLMIRPHDLSRVSAAVRDLGYTPHASLSPAEQRAYLKSGYELSFDGEAGLNLLEVQWGLQPRFYAVDYDMPGLFRRANTVTVAGRPMKTPSTEDLLLVLSLHAAKHVWGRLIWLRDIAQITAMPNLNWNWIEDQAQELGVTRILAVTLLLARELLGAAIPSAAQNLIRDAAAPTLAVEIQAHVVSETAYDVESSSYFRLMLRLRERRSDRVRFVRRLILTPGPNEWKAARLPAALFPLYRMVRLCRLATRLARR